MNEWQLAETESAKQAFSTIQTCSSMFHLAHINWLFLSFHVLERLLTFAASHVIVWGRLWGRIGSDGKEIGSFKHKNGGNAY